MVLVIELLAKRYELAGRRLGWCKVDQMERTIHVISSAVHSIRFVCSAYKVEGRGCFDICDGQGSAPTPERR